MSSINLILDGLNKVRRRGKANEWQACCPVHNDKTPSLSIKLLDDDRVIMHCFGCGANGVEIVQALGIELDALFPESQDKDSYKRERRPFPAAQILESLETEALIVSIAASKMLSGDELSIDDINRIRLAQQRIEAGLNYAK